MGPNRLDDQYKRINTNAAFLKDMGPRYEGKNQTKYREKLTELVDKTKEDMKYELKLTEAEAKPLSDALAAIQQNTSDFLYEKPLKSPPVEWDQKAWDKPFTDAMQALDDLKPSPASTPEEKKKFQNIVNEKKQELANLQKEELEKAVTQLEKALDRQKTTKQQAKLAVEERKRLREMSGVEDKPPIPLTRELTEEELKDQESQGHIQIVDPDDKMMKEMEALQASKGKLYKCDNHPYRGKLLEYSKDGARPVITGSVDKKTYAGLYGEAIKLVRDKQPGCKMVFKIPVLNDPYKRDEPGALKFLTAKHINEKITPVLEQAAAGRIPMRLDGPLKEHLQKVRAENHAKLYAERDQGLEDAIDKLFAVEEGMKSRAERDKTIGNDRKGMEDKVDRATKRTVVDEKLMSEAKITIQHVIPGYNSGDAGVATQAIDAKLNEIKSERAQVGESIDLINSQLFYLNKKLQAEVNDAYKQGTPLPPFLKSQIEKLEGLADRQREKLQELQAKAEVLHKEAKDLNSQFGTADTRALQDRAKTVEKSVADAGPVYNACAQGIDDYNKEYKKEAENKAHVVARPK